MMPTGPLFAQPQTYSPGILSLVAGSTTQPNSCGIVFVRSLNGAPGIGVEAYPIDLMRISAPILQSGKSAATAFYSLAEPSNSFLLKVTPLTESDPST